jgi:hypothetical protein
MIEWYTTVALAIAVVAGILCLALGLVGRRPADLTMGATALVEVALLVQIVLAVLAPAFGNTPSGSGLEFWIYLVSAAVLPPLAILWGLVEPGRWSTAVLGVVNLAVAVMVWRMHQIWFVQLA